MAVLSGWYVAKYLPRSKKADPDRPIRHVVGHFDLQTRKTNANPELSLFPPGKLYCYDYVDSKDIFNYMIPMYQLKAKGNKYAKLVLITTWGSLGKKNEFTVPLELLLDDAIKNVTYIDPVKNIATVENKESPYRHASGRIKSFLMAYARLMLVETMLKVENAGYEIYQANTDGFISNIPPEQMTEIKTISSLMGDIKIEKVYKGTYDVKHVRRVDKVEF
jgi:hypothetical protein